MHGTLTTARIGRAFSVSKESRRLRLVQSEGSPFEDLAGSWAPDLTISFPRTVWLATIRRSARFSIDVSCSNTPPDTCFDDLVRQKLRGRQPAIGRYQHAYGMQFLANGSDDQERAAVVHFFEGVLGALALDDSDVLDLGFVAVPREADQPSPGL